MEIELKRDIYEELLKWKKRSSGLVLELEGARQVGKTYILDKFAKDSILELKEQIKEEYSKYTKLIKKLEEFNIDEGQKAREIEFAEYEVNEIESANLKPEEDVQVEEEFKKLSNSKEIVSALSEIYNALGYETAGGLGDIINKAVMDINSIKGMDEKISQFQTELYDIDNLCRELTSQIYDYNSGMDFNPEYVREVEERLDVINHLKLKYGNSIEEILRYKEEKEEYLEKLNNMTDEMENVKNQISELEGTLNNLCTKLSEQRKKAAKELEVLVKQALVDLNFIAVEFEIQITRKESIGENGFDNVEFMISTNPGESVKPLVKVASGGELSRIMLAIKSILATEDDIDTLIFDEIDTGISGQTAMKVAEKMAKISRNHQVICISHLSQIAAMADSHYLIKKTADENSTTTSIKKLTRQQSIEELVRINGGSGITEAGLIHATEMKDMADRTKSNLF